MRGREESWVMTRDSRWCKVTDDEQVQPRREAILAEYAEEEAEAAEIEVAENAAARTCR